MFVGAKVVTSTETLMNSTVLIKTDQKVKNIGNHLDLLMYTSGSLSKHPK